MNGREVPRLTSIGNAYMGSYLRGINIVNEIIDNQKTY